ncbi:TPA: hypothetical protein MW242_003049 [Acinetobacter baumannii]|nr:hypothetical protein [Acinetobacter baumannii]
MKNILIILTIMGIVSGCSSTPEEEKLDDYLLQTKTEKSQRTIDWYYSHDYERSDVLNLCYDIYIKAAEKAGYYSQDISDGKEQYLDPAIQKKLYSSNKECLTALTAQERLDNFVSAKSLPQELLEQRSEVELQDTPASDVVQIENSDTPEASVPKTLEQVIKEN